MDNQTAEQVALFRFGVIAPLVDRHLPWGQRQRLVEEIVHAQHKIPGSSRTSISRATVEKWLGRYLRSGAQIESLKPAVRADKGESRSIDPETEAGLVTLRREFPQHSLAALLSIARQRKIIDTRFHASKQSVYRLFARHGLHREPSQTADRRKFEAELPNDLWQSDCMHGPKIIVDGVMRKTYLFAIIDDHSRLIPHAQFYPSENIDCLRDCLLQAFEKRGLPRRLYTDNGSAFRTHQLRYGCAQLGIALLHSEPGAPEGRGKIERLFRTVRSQFLPLLDEAQSLEQMNSRLCGWIDGEYHARVHTSTGSTPLERYLAHLSALRPAPRDLREYFRIPVKRKVDKDRSVSLNGRLFEAPVGLIGRWVTLLYHAQDPVRVEVLCDERSHGFLVPLNPGVNSRVRRSDYHGTELEPEPPQQIPGSYHTGSLFEESRS